MTTFGYARAEDSPGFVLWQVTNLWQRTIRAALTPLGITHVQFVLLAGIAWLSEAGAVVTQATLAHHARIDIMMTSQVVRVLAEKDLLTRAPHPTDSRAKVLALTDAGRAVTQRAVVAVEAADAHFFKEVISTNPAFVDQLRQLLATNEDTPPSAS